MLDRILQALSTQIREQLALAREIDHRGESGRARENIVAEFLGRLIPGSYDISTGFVIDRNGNRSRQVDLVVYRTDRHPVFDVGGIKHFPAESVVAVIENKARIADTETLRRALENIASVKRLTRTSSTNAEVEFGPFRREVSLGFCLSIFGAITTEHSLSPQTLGREIAAFIANRAREEWPNMYVDVGEHELVGMYWRPDREDHPHTVDPWQSGHFAVSKGPLAQAAMVRFGFEIANVIRIAPTLPYMPQEYLTMAEFESERWEAAPLPPEHLRR